MEFKNATFVCICLVVKTFIQNYSLASEYVKHVTVCQIVVFRASNDNCS